MYLFVNANANQSESFEQEKCIDSLNFKCASLPQSITFVKYFIVAIFFVKDYYYGNKKSNCKCIKKNNNKTNKLILYSNYACILTIHDNDKDKVYDQPKMIGKCFKKKNC